MEIIDVLAGRCLSLSETDDQRLGGPTVKLRRDINDNVVFPGRFGQSRAFESSRLLKRIGVTPRAARVFALSSPRTTTDISRA
jgi:hypothetical protein